VNLAEEKVMEGKATPVLPMLGKAVHDRFMGVRRIKRLDDYEGDVVVIGIPCATPYQDAVEYTTANLKAPTAIRRAMGRWASTAGRVDFDFGHPTFSSQDEMVGDYGDLPTDPKSPEANRELIRSTVSKVIQRNAAAIVIGGDDSISIPLIAGLESLKEVVIVQIDAHIDWRDEVGGERNGLSSVMRRASELPFVTRIIQIGQRGFGSAGLSDLAAARAAGVRFVSAEDVFDRGINPILEHIPEGSNVYINLDLDGLDPSIMPAVFVPAPGGLQYWHVLKLIRGVAAKANLRALAVVEFVPDKDPDGLAALTAGRLTAAAIAGILKKREATRGGVLRHTVGD
jgi:agmatinase